MNTKGTDPRAGNLPAETTSLVGRRSEIAEVKRLLSAGPLVTLTGVGGVGKTRLALRVAAEVRRAFPDGVWLADLAGPEAAGTPEQTVASVLCVRTAGRAALARHLADRRVLLVLDTCEPAIRACATLTGDLLRLAPDLRVLATGRQPLGVDGEHIFEVPPLGVPETDDAPPDDLARSAAVRLFAERAAAVVPGYTVAGAGAAAVVRLCRRLDGVPLAIELAAVRTRTLSAQQILARLDDRFTLLRRTGPAGPPRQRTLRAAVDWSHRLCTPHEQILWARMSVFAGGFGLEAAEQVCAGDGLPADAVLDLTAGLVEKSILCREAGGGHARYRLPETLRRYGRDRLAESGYERVVRGRHRDRYRDLALRGDAEWFGPRQAEWLDRLAGERADLAAALDFCLDEPDGAGSGLRMAAALWGRPLPCDLAGDGRRPLERGLAAGAGPAAVRARALFAYARIHLLRGDPAAARAPLRECRALAEALGDAALLAGVTHASALAAQAGADLPRACTLLEKALAGYRAAGDDAGAWLTLWRLAVTAVLLGDDRAAGLAAECLETCERAGAAWSRTDALWACGLDRWRRGRLDTAAGLVMESLRAKRVRLDPEGLARCVETLGWIAADEERREHAAELLGAAGALWRESGVSPAGRGHLEGPRRLRTARLRRACGERAFAAAYARGLRLGPEGARAYALGGDPPAGGADAGADAGVATALTRREREIAELVARGLSNKEIAASLVIAQRTAEGHVERILRKLGFTSRTQIAAAWAAGKGAA